MSDERDQSIQQPSIFSSIDQEVNRWQAVKMVQRSAVPALQLGLYALYTAASNNPSPDTLAAFRTQFINVNKLERRDVEVTNPTYPMRTEIFSPLEPSHQEALDRFDITTAHDEADGLWKLTLPATFSSDTQLYMLTVLQELGVLPHAEQQGIGSILPIHLTFAIPESLSSVFPGNQAGFEHSQFTDVIQSALTILYSSPEGLSSQPTAVPAINNSSFILTNLELHTDFQAAEHNGQLLRDAHRLITALTQVFLPGPSHLKDSLEGVYSVFATSFVDLLERYQISQDFLTDHELTQRIFAFPAIRQEVLEIVSQASQEIGDFLHRESLEE